MPYESAEDVKRRVKGTSKLSGKKRRQFMHVFNSCYSKYHDDAKCHAMAWGVTNKGCDDCSGTVPTAVLADASILSLDEFCEYVSKMAPPVDIPGAKGSMGEKPGEQWHEIASDPGYLRRYEGTGPNRKLIRIPKPGAKHTGKPSEEKKPKEKKPEKKPTGKMSKYEGLPSAANVSGMSIDPETGRVIASVNVRGRTLRVRMNPKDLGKLPEEWRNLLDPKNYHESKIDRKTGEMVVSGVVNGKTMKFKFSKPDDAKHLPGDWQRHLVHIASSRELSDVLKHLKSFSSRVTKDSDEKEEGKKKEEQKIDISTPSGARAMALALTRLFGGWNGGCRLSPSANRVDTYHISVFCGTPQELGQRILDLKQHLIDAGYREAEEGVFHHETRSVYLGRSYSSKKGKRPLVFMITVRTK